jgi:glycosyltransferase involved in cell wall biosynthesis
MLSIAALYGMHPLDLESTAAVPRLHAQLLTMLASAHPDWDILAISPEAKPLRGLDALGVELSRGAHAKLRVGETRIGRRLYRPRAANGQRLDKALWAQAAAARLAASRPDRPSTIVICANAQAVLAARRTMPRSRIVHWLHTPGSLEAGLAADAAVVPSVAVYRDTWRRVGHQYPPPIWVIPNWVDVEIFRPPGPDERRDARNSWGLDEQDRVIAFIGRHWLKGAKVIERALVALPQLDQRVVLLSAGEPRRVRRTLAPGREVWNLGLLPPTELRRMYQASDLGVAPSVGEENSPLAVLEMMAQGLPVIASRVGGVSELVEDGITGRLVDVPNSVDEWVDAIADAIADAEACGKMGVAARATVLRKFTPALAEQEWTRVLVQLGSDSH